MAENKTSPFKTITIKIEQRHIDGADGTGGNNPISRAVRETLKKSESIDIELGYNFIRIGEKQYRIPMWVGQTDVEWGLGKGMKPFEFTLTNRPFGEVPATDSFLL